MHFHLGHVFISHTATDKPLVRALATRLREAGFHIWVDERDLLVGDPLAERVGDALAKAKVVIVVVSTASVASKWLRYELNMATERMIRGECRVIPVVIDETPLPPEVRGLLYADCRPSIDAGLPAILTALGYESRKAAMQQSFSSRVDRLVSEVFGLSWSESLGGPYQRRDYELVSLPVEDDNGNQETRVFLEVVPSYLTGHDPLTPEWYVDYVKSTEAIPEIFSLLVTERPVAFPIPAAHNSMPRVRLEQRSWEFQGLRIPSRQIVVADLSGMADEEAQRGVLGAARKTLIECAAFVRETTRSYRERLERGDEPRGSGAPNGG
jgi:hypothetical protein